MGTVVFCCYRYLHSSPSFKQACVGRIRTTGGHVINGSLCDLGQIWTRFHAPNISHTPSVYQGPPWFQRGEEPLPALPATTSGAQLPRPSAVHHCQHLGTVRLIYTTGNARACWQADLTHSILSGADPSVEAWRHPSHPSLPHIHVPGTVCPTSASRRGSVLGLIWVGAWEETRRNAQHTFPGPAQITVPGGGPELEL